MTTPEEKTCLRELAKRVAEIADLPVQETRRNLWKKHHVLNPIRPMILIFPEGSWRELLPQDRFVCQDPFLRNIERQLRVKIYTHEHFDTDYATEKTLNVGRRIGTTGWGMEAQRTDSSAPTGAWGFKPVMETYADAKKLTHPQLTRNDAAAQKDLERVQGLLGDILTVRQKGITHNACNLAALFSSWRGLNQLYMDMVEAPEWVHEVLAFITEGLINLWKQYEDQGLLSLNNEDDYHSSGGIGYTDTLPGPNFDPEHVRFANVWGSAQSQEMTAVSPGMHAEFFMKYESEFIKPFALNGYGCCDDLTLKLDDVCAMPQMRRISISPYADVPRSTEQLRGNYILSWKTDPRDLVGAYSPERIRQRIHSALESAREHGSVFEMILKDTHTCDNRPKRFDTWSQIAREEVNRVMETGR